MTTDLPKISLQARLDGTVLYSSDNFDEDGDPILPAEPFIHHYAGWEV